MASVEEQLQSSVLAAQEVRDETDWSDIMVEEWLNFIRNIVTVAASTDSNTELLFESQQHISELIATTQKSRGRIHQNAKLTKENTSDIAELQNAIADIFNFYPLKGVMFLIKGAAAANPTITDSYNIASIVRAGVGVYTVTMSQATIYGISIATVNYPSIDFNIAPSATSDAYMATVSGFAGTTFTLNVYALQVGAGGAGSNLVRVPYDLQLTDNLTLTVLLNGGSAVAPP